MDLRDTYFDTEEMGSVIAQDRMEAIQKIVARWVENLQPTAVLVFGSTARGTVRPDSDIDVIVLWDDHHELPNRQRRMKLRDVAGEVPFPMDILTYTTQEWDKAIADPLSFTANIAKEATIVYGGLH